MEASPEQFLKLPHGGRICYQTFGPHAGTPVLLLSGGGQSMLSWHEDLIAQPASALSQSNPSSPPSSSSSPARDYLFVRYDTRDTGRSTHYACLDDEARRRYTLDDLLADALALLDHVCAGGGNAVRAAHLVGFSMGGATAWMLAARHPHRVRSITLVSSSPVGPAGDVATGIPSVDEATMKRVEAVARPAEGEEWMTDRESVVRFLVGFEEACMGDEEERLTGEEEREGETRAGWAFDRAARVARDAKQQMEDEDQRKGSKSQDNGRLYERGEERANVSSFFNQAGAAWAAWPREELRRVACPAVVVHGDGDGNVPLRHGEVLAEEMSGGEGDGGAGPVATRQRARLVVVRGMGHGLRRRHWGAVVEEVRRVVVAAHGEGAMRG